MPPFCRFINYSERKQLWSILLVQITLVVLSWYYIKKMESDNECYRILIRDYFFPSPYIDVPDNCLWWTIFWFRLNRYTIFTTGPFIIYVLFEYDISAYHSLMYLYIWISLLFNAHWAEKQENIFYRDAPYLFHLLLTVLYLEKDPFHFSDAQLIERCYNIDMENCERLSAHEEADSRCWSETICRIRQCDNIVDGICYSELYVNISQSIRSYI